MPPPRMTTETLKVVGAMLSDPTADWYGLELSRRAGLQPGTIYPILDRLLRAGWLERRWEDVDPTVEGRPRRRLYRVTGEGARAGRRAIDEHVTSLRPEPAPRLTPSPGGTLA
jgi:PadR family transcriptional regulator PadR